MGESGHRARVMSPEAYGLHDGRFVQEKSAQSAAVATQLQLAPVPADKVWTIIQGAYFPDIAETRTVQFLVVTKSSWEFAISNPAAVALGPNIRLPVVTEGLELRLFPGDVLRIRRDAATALSTMIMGIRYIETDLPYYSYEEPLKKVARVTQRHGSVYRSSGGISIGGGMPGGGHGGEGGGGGGGAEPY